MTDEQERTAKLWGRYLDAQGKPIPVGGAAPAGGDTTGATAGPIDLSVFGLEYKRLPVRMVLRMDQRWLPRLIAECANQPLQIEVQEVHINTPDAGGLEAGSPGGFRSMGERGPGGGSPGGNLSIDHTVIEPFPQQPNIVNVVIQGTIYIFNKPNKSILQPPTDEQPLASTGG